MIIGLTQRVLFHNEIAYDSIEHGWYSLLKDHTLTFVSNRIDQNLDELADTLDVLVLTGGDDSTIRRIVETRLSIEMLKRKKPIIGICHGAFLLTDLCGGKVDSIEGHHNIEHEITCDKKQLVVNSYHTLRISEAPKQSTVLAIDCDNNCEAWIDGNIAAIVWHPERMKQAIIPEQIKNLWNI